MCTAITFVTHKHYFGRNLDLHYSYDESVAVTPRHFPFHFRYAGKLPEHYAMIGIATVDQNYPLYYDATNEFGLSLAGLNFPELAVYQPVSDQNVNIAPFELIPWVLAQFKSVEEALAGLRKINLANIVYSNDYPLTPLHWMMADSERCVVLEPMADGLHIHENPFGVLTNSPDFDFHQENVRQYLNLSSMPAVNRFCEQVPLTPFSHGMGAIGLPGDLSSASRFVRAAFTKLNSVCAPEEAQSVGQFFHILGSVEQTKGCAKIDDRWEYTVYSSCCNTDEGIYYYRTYEDSQIRCVKLHNCDINSEVLTFYPLVRANRIQEEN